MILPRASPICLAALICQLMLLLRMAEAFTTIRPSSASSLNKKIISSSTTTKTSMLALAPQSLPPVNTEVKGNDMTSVKDYFIPTSSEEAARRAIEEYAKSKQAAKGGEMIQSADMIQIDTAMPGVKGSKPVPMAEASLPTPTYNKEIDKKEVLWISQQFDIYLRRLPQAAFIYALLDFFILPTSRAVISDELEEDGGRVAVAKDWAGRAAFRVGVFSTIVVATSVFESVFYHPI